MKIVLSASQPDLEGEIDPRFGRCRYLIFVDSETMNYEVEENPGLEIGGGAGIRAAQCIVDKESGVLITGRIGPNAYRVLEAAGIEMFTGVSGAIRDIVEIYRSGELRRSPGPTEAMATDCGRGRGDRRGRRAGFGGSGGESMKQNRIPQRTEGVEQSAVSEESAIDRIAYLKDQAQVLAERLARIQMHIQQLEEETCQSSQ